MKPIYCGATLFVLNMLLSPAAFSQGMILADQLRQLPTLKSTFTLVDVRNPSDYQQQHIDGAVNIPAEKIGSADLPKDVSLILYCGDSRCPLSHEAAKTLAGNGYGDVKVLYGGLAEWTKKGYSSVAQNGVSSTPTQQNTVLMPKELWGSLHRHERTLILDVRPAQEFGAGHLPGAKSVPLESLADGAASLPKDIGIVVYDRIPDRSAKAVAQLTSASLSARVLFGGISSWSALGYTVETGTRNGP